MHKNAWDSTGSIKDQLMKPRWWISKDLQHILKVPEIYQDSNMISKHIQNTHKYTKMIKELLREIGSTNTSL